jgi:hypothetical protein
MKSSYKLNCHSFSFLTISSIEFKTLIRFHKNKNKNWFDFEIGSNDVEFFIFFQIQVGATIFYEGFGIWKVKITLTSYAWFPTSPSIAHGHKCRHHCGTSKRRSN